MAARIRILNFSGVEIGSIRLSLPCVVGIKHVVDQCDETRAALRSEVEKPNIKLHYLGESGRVAAGLLHAIADTRYANDYPLSAEKQCL